MEAHSPPKPELNDPTAFRPFVLMDDAIFVEPELGLRRWCCAAAFEEGLAKLLGPRALNLKKLEEEGAFSTVGLIWGFLYDTERGTCQLPEQKLLKGAYLVTEPCFDAGETRIPLLEVQRLRGNATFWQTVQPALKPELGAIDALLSQDTFGDPYVFP